MTDSKDATLLACVFGTTLFLSAALMFSIQPMIGKMLLPIVGGTPAGWIVAMAFFQIMLLAGYFLAHFFSTVKPSTHGILFLLAICAGFIFLPASIRPLNDGVPGPFDVFAMLFSAVAVPFVALSAASSTLQRLFTQTRHPRAQDPYFLYAISNLGSFVGLFAYPFLIDPLTGLKMQGHLWLGGYLLLALFIAASLFLSLRERVRDAQEKKDVPDVAPPSLKQKLEWIALAFFPSSLLLGVTTHITSHIFPAPMMWVIPLGLYLVTFIIAFGSGKFFKLQSFSVIHPAAVALVIAAMLSNKPELNSSGFALVIHMGIFFVTAMMCHMRLAALRPDGGNLTSFYLMLSIGGALGGILNAFLAPLILNAPVEYPIVLVLSLLMNPLFGSAKLRNGRAIRNGFVVMLTAFVIMASFMTEGILLRDRSFYGTLTVAERPLDLSAKNAGDAKLRALLHGSTVHGVQIMTPADENEPGTYFTRQGPAGDVFTAFSPKEIAIIGLGTGSMNCYVPADGHAVFIDIDPAIIKAASTHFTFLDKCSPAGKPEIILGDGRLALDRIENRKFDIIALDAFSADAIPTHLLTIEAIKGYRAKLNENGVILFHISNRYVNLAPVLGRNAQEVGLKALARFDKQKKSSDKTIARFHENSHWLVIVDKNSDTSALTEKGWIAPLTDNQKPWTDDYTNLAATLSIFNK